MSDLWTIDDFLAATGGRPLEQLPDGISGISIDSRAVSQGDAFFAIKGDRFDGHDFTSAAMANGAALLVVSEAKLPALGRVSAPMVVVDDVLDALGRLAVAARARTKAQIIAVTGSVGKTTTKAMLRHVLSTCGKTHAAVASFNNHWGVPLTLARMPADAKYGVFEIGMNHPGEITPLVKLVRPHVAIITTIAPAHLGNFKNIGEIAAAKAEIFDGLVPGGHAILNRDNEKFAVLKKAAKAAGIERIHAFGAHKQADFRLEKLKLHGACSCMTARVDADEVVVKIGSPGRHIAENALAVMGAAHLVGADLAKITAALADFKAEKGRGAQYKLRNGSGEFVLIDESYNANPASMRAAISLLSNAPLGASGRRIAILGDMLELGRFSAKLHAELAGPLAEAKVDRVYLAGPEMRALEAALPGDIEREYRESTAALIPLITRSVHAGDAIMVKSSLGIGFGAVVSALLDKFPAVPEAEAGD
ncbi:UDP-N-acetylmuramoylalanyl-D-glutamyl-2,6-diaminopimelate--D-alanyl-D-alanine ligase [Pararhizobium haloflavum]|uniref:UDP-N-acetylmuramoylalanyl-D-glutamyl-2, 6-diaminopimelate--D-alanyl-D-alanine ligase n=1 Tax=Pararhizobium haloflavum TaxID=2037914 RepID=UPI000C1759B8|nr:UDP-N-acetylmuramoylalanyl-D-glutamyl-2,6-diaminopimelate--D-alanyl-D-alanine ligase [Pararhizobium haloflavum]